MSGTGFITVTQVFTLRKGCDKIFAMQPSKSIIITRPNGRAQLRLFTFSPAGYGASFYRQWPGLLPQWVELCSVQLPGRESRLRETAVAEMGRLVETLAEELKGYFDRPMMFFGHSMGAWVAYELANQLNGEYREMLKGLLLSGRRAPYVPDRLPPIHTLPDDEFIAELQRRYGGIPEVVLKDAELMTVFLPTLRADVTLLETFRPAHRPALETPITVYGGRDDPMTLPEELAAWRKCTCREFDCMPFPGGHYYLQDRLPELLLQVNARLEWVRYG